MGGARAGRWHLVLLLGACALAFLHRTVRSLPWLDAVQDSWPLLLGIAAGLYAVGPLLRFGFALAARPGVTRLARDLDDRYGWHDQTDTALHAAADPGGLGALLAVQAGGRLREIDARALARAGRPLGRIRLILALLFVALLVLPGVGGIFGGEGAGTRGGDGFGSAGLEDDFGAPGPMPADFWFQAFVENPIPVEPLPDAGDDAAPDAPAVDAAARKAPPRSGK